MNEPIKYREYVITIKSDLFWYEHVEYTGAEDKRCGNARTMKAAESDIDNMTIEEQDHQIEVLRKKISDLELLNSCNEKQIERHEQFIRRV